MSGSSLLNMSVPTYCKTSLAVIFLPLILFCRSSADIKWIIETYSKQGADEFVIEMELEAFSIAATIDPGTIAKAINNTCSYRF